jgi:hypothetical protein
MKNKQQKSDTSIFVMLIIAAALVWVAQTYTWYFIGALILIIGLLILGYFKIQRFHAWVNSKFHRRKSAAPSVPVRLINGVRPAIICPVCKDGTLEPIANMPKFWMCNNCHRVQEKL